jgi:hypothetical protein
LSILKIISEYEIGKAEIIFDQDILKSENVPMAKDIFLEETQSFMTMGQCSFGKVLFPGIEYVLVHSLCGFVLGTKKNTSS